MRIYLAIFLIAQSLRSASRARWTASLLHLVLASSIAGCGGGGGGGSEDPPKAEGRRFLLSATAVQAVPNFEPFYQLAPAGFSLSDLAQDVDVVTVVLEHYGVPWDEFAAASSPPQDHPWTIAMNRFAEAALASGKPVAVQTVLSRASLAGKAVSRNGMLVVESNWTSACFNFANAPQYARAYERFAAWIAARFRPQHFVHAVEVNSFYESCGEGVAWTALVEVANRSRRAIKSVSPVTQVYPSFTLNELYGGTANGFDDVAVDALQGLERDRLGLSVYPQGVRNTDGAPLTPTDLPADYLQRVRHRNPAEPKVVITETGWNSENLALGPPTNCAVALGSDERVAAGYLAWLFRRAQDDAIELVTWWSNRDLLPEHVMSTCYPDAEPPAHAACQGDPWCAAVNVFRTAYPDHADLGESIFKAFGTMGLRSHDGTPKPAMWAVWQAALGRPRED